MRFASPPVPDRDAGSPFTAFIGKLLGGHEPPPRLPQAQQPAAALPDLPMDLDQRVRLVGEW